MNDVVGKDEKGKPVFLGKEDPSNPPIVPIDPNTRYCSICKKYNDNAHEACLTCGHFYADSKMQCPVCKKWFDYLLGDDGNGGIRGCENDWKPPTRPQKGAYESERTKDVSFD